MELIPKVLVVGLFAATPPGAPDRDRLNRLWAEISSREDYRQFSVTGEGAQFVGASADDALLIQPPLVQFRSSARLGLQNAAEEAQFAIRTAARHLAWTQFFNLGIKQVYNAPAPNNDARSFVLQRLVHLEETALNPLERGGTFWAGVKFGAPAIDNSSYTVVIEPLLKDNQMLFIDLDIQVPGPIDPEKITERANEASEYASNNIRQYLDTP